MSDFRPRMIKKIITRGLKEKASKEKIEEKKESRIFFFHIKLRLIYYF